MTGMQIKSICAAVCFVAAAPTNLDARAHSAGAMDKGFTKCPGEIALGKAADVSWSPQPSHLHDHVAVRERLHAPLPDGTDRILFWSFGMHHTSVRFSVIAVRNAQGVWHTNAVGEEGPGLLRIEPHPMQVIDRDLSPEQVRALDQVLADDCLYASPTFQRDPNNVAGGAGQTVEIETPHHRWIGSWLGVRTPQEDALIQLIAQ